MIEAPVQPAPVEVTTPIKASEAIRLGCLIAPYQEFGTLGRGNRACVMRAMEIGGDSDSWLQSKAASLTVADGCPVGCPKVLPIPFTAEHLDTRRLIVHLNDDHRWTRERIAEWLEGQGL